VGREVDHARTVAYGAAIAALDGNTSPLSDAIRVELQSALLHANGATSSDEDTSPTGLRLSAVRAARRALLAMRANGEIGDNAFHRLEEEIDRLELSAS
jgi:monovalent cation/hydrogen antiporter